MAHDHPPTSSRQVSPDADPAEHWEEFYGGDDHPWTGKPNQLLVDHAPSPPAPGATALDIGCGSGADAVWLAEQGWQTLGIDLAEAALRHARAAASRSSAADRVRWQQCNVSTDFPAGEWDLISASYLHSPVKLERITALRRAADAVRPGGVLIIIGHQGMPEWVQRRWHEEGLHDVSLPTTADVLADLNLDRDVWTVEVDAVDTVSMSDPDGNPCERTDNILRLRRRM
ncbi:class I SAM-dependent methyltransferase [Jongsikchunia kroppenstedtii]|uniref:class I SAM-dependent methyltransferase n=1 Tax=Jongsikchunia kroppenstedtii TaxID=1121721 RepID=UPI00035EB41C|nr:class I SAM-dependent methyltransferase [Jongsikchunia kroppenstedtii]